MQGSENGQKWTFAIFWATIVFIVSIVITGIIVQFVTQGNTRQIIMIVLLCVLIVFGTAGFITVHLRLRRSVKKNTKPKYFQTIRTFDPTIYKRAPTAPPLTDYSHRSTMQA